MDAEGNTSMTTAPDQTEAAEHYFKYIEQVPAGDICDILAAQATELLGLFETITETQSLHRHAPGRWSLRQVANDLNDTERLFVSHAFWFARGFDTPLPSFDQDVAIAAAAADERSWFSHVDEFRSVRDATLTFFQGLPAHAWARRGLATGRPFTVKALAFITVGHVAHHMKIVRDKYLPA